MSEASFDWVWWVWSGVSVVIVAFKFARSRGRGQWFREAPVRRHHLDTIDLASAAIIYLTTLLASSLVFSITSLPEWTEQNIANQILAGGQVMLSLVIILLAKNRFAESLVGFGLQVRFRAASLAWTGLYFFTATGVTLGVLTLTVAIYEYFGGQMPKHAFLELMGEQPPLASLILLVALPVVIAPIAEELFFRGLLQSVLSKFFHSRICPVAADQADGLPDDKAYHAADDRSRWAAILLTSLIFACFHQWHHWPALIVLATFLGYCYERHGNLWMCIVIHSLFNLLPIAITLLS